MARYVYAITSGQYSDYRVHHVYERKQDAQTLARAMNAKALDKYREYAKGGMDYWSQRLVRTEHYAMPVCDKTLKEPGMRSCYKRLHESGGEDYTILLMVLYAPGEVGTIDEG